MKSQNISSLSPSKNRKSTVSIPYSRQTIDAEDMESVLQVLKSDFITQGPAVRAFEQAVARYCGESFGVAVSSGTAALHLACLAAGIGTGDEVITSPTTFAASANSVLYCGGTPVLADVDPTTLCIDPLQIEKKITKKTKAIIPVDFGGVPAPLNEINRIAKKHGLIVIEDAAHSLGATYQGKKIGSLVDLTVFSFHPVKTITTGEGGMILTSKSEWNDLMQRFRHHGIVKGNLVRQKALANDPTYYEIHDLGFNYRITDIQCALGIAQMKRIDYFIAKRTQIAERYQKAFLNHPKIALQQVPSNSTSAYHLLPIQIDFKKTNLTRADFYNALFKKGIRIQVHYMPLNLHLYYQKKLGWRKGGCPMAERYYEKAVSLPIYPDLTAEDQDYVIQNVLELIG